MAKKSWVDGTKMGIDGHSFGGFETNYIVTHSNLFAAACSASGLVNLISTFGALQEGSGIALTGYNEWGQNRIGGTLWQKQTAYLDNSPILAADKVTPPPPADGR